MADVDVVDGEKIILMGKRAYRPRGSVLAIEKSSQ